MHCNNCGSKISGEDKFCLKCGAVLIAEKSIQTHRLFEQKGKSSTEKPFENKQMHTKGKWILPLAIILGCCILGGFFYAIQVVKQNSIEKQQLLKIDEDRRLEDIKMEQVKKEYTAKRKNDCLNIYKTEGEKYNNVSGWNYDDEIDLCNITYKEQKPKSASQCDKDFPTENGGTFWFRLNYLCKNGEFEKAF